jgi:hypothetical protein
VTGDAQYIKGIKIYGIGILEAGEKAGQAHGRQR